MSDLLNAYMDIQFFYSETILSQKNDIVTKFNTYILKDLSGEGYVFEFMN